IALKDNEGGTIVTDSITSDGLTDFINHHLKGVHHRFKRGYKNVINEAKRLNSLGINAPLAIETSGHAAMRENYFLDDGAYLVTKIVILMAELKKEGKKLSDILDNLVVPKESEELRFNILSDHFKEIGEMVIDKLKEFAVKNNITIVPNNYEGIRLSFDKDNGDGWLLLRLSVHDPVMPLNIESNIEGGSKIIAHKLYKFFEKSAFFTVDISSLKKFIK
ncbi:MAG: phosphomannomutase/phosphoglucomutase, partial [Clostridia bacterium]|nr:phosphomannomutase/phosphoglucomutase [Clostridia bacterium]